LWAIAVVAPDHDMDAFCAFHSQFELFLLILRITDKHECFFFEGREESSAKP